MAPWTQEDVDRHNAKLGAKMPAHVPAPQKSKYRNVRTVVDGEKFDSQREASYWAELILREKSGEIANLKRQVKFELYCPTIFRPEGIDSWTQVAFYVADFVFDDLREKRQCVQDIKGQKETAMFALKRKWLLLQSGIEIEVVR